MELRIYRNVFSALLCVIAASASLGAEHSPPGDAPDTKISVVPEPTETTRYLKDERQTTQGSAIIAGRALSYQAEAGILVVHVKDPMDDDAPPPREDKSGACSASAPTSAPSATLGQRFSGGSLRCVVQSIMSTRRARITGV